MKTWKQERAILVDRLGMGDDWTCTEFVDSAGHVRGYWVDAEDKAHNGRSKAIEALPDLLEHLQRLVNICTHPKATKDGMRMIAKEARATIAKATGQ